MVQQFEEDFQDAADEAVYQANIQINYSASRWEEIAV
jgi:hypothetical protein